MEFKGKDLGILAGLAAGSFVAGGVIGYLIGGSNTEVREKSLKSYMIEDPITKYVIQNSLREPEIMKELRDYTLANVDMAVMLTDPIQCQLFRLLLNSLDAKKCLEVGVFTGYNVLNCALCLPPGGVVYGLDINERWVNHGRAFFKKANVEDKIDIRIAPALETMKKLIAEGHQGTFDFIYVDADKEGYDNYYEQGLVLLRTGGIICFDNMLQSGRVTRIDQLSNLEHISEAKALDKLNKKLHIDNRIQVSFLNIGDGCYFGRKI